MPGHQSALPTFPTSTLHPSPPPEGCTLPRPRPLAKSLSRRSRCPSLEAYVDGRGSVRRAMRRALRRRGAPCRRAKRADGIPGPKGVARTPAGIPCILSPEAGRQGSPQKRPSQVSGALPEFRRKVFARICCRARGPRMLSERA